MRLSMMHFDISMLDREGNQWWIHSLESCSDHHGEDFIVKNIQLSKGEDAPIMRCRFLSDMPDCFEEWRLEELDAEVALEHGRSLGNLIRDEEDYISELRAESRREARDE